MAIREAMMARLDDPVEMVRREAGTILENTSKHNSDCIDVVIMVLQRQVSVRRETTLRALAKIAVRGEGKGLVAIYAELDNQEGMVRRAAALALTQVAFHGDADVVKALGELIRDDFDNRVVIWACRALASFVSKGNRRAMEYIRYRFDAWLHRGDNAILPGMGRARENPVSIRCQAIDSFTQIALPGDWWAFNAVIDMTDDFDHHIRSHAVPALVQLVATKRQQEDAYQAISALLACENACNATLRRAAETSLAELARSKYEDPNLFDGISKAISSNLHCCRRRRQDESQASPFVDTPLALVV